MTRIRITTVLVLAAAAAACSSSSPELLSVTELDNTSSTIGPYEVVAVVLDEGFIDRVELLYRLDGGPWQSIVMDEVNGTTWRGAIPGQPMGTVIDYECAALDDDGEISRLPKGAEVLTFQVVAP